MFAYRLLISIFAVAAMTSAFRRGGSALLRARLGGGARLDHPQLWWHGASNGELASARPLLERLLRDRPDLRVVVTANSTTGLRLVESWGIDRVTVRPAPLDLAWVTRRVLRRWRVIAHVTLEAELWPNRVRLCPGPVMLVGARMTEGTARGWARLPGLARAVTGRLAFASAQDRDSAERLARLGLRPEATGPVADLKALYTPPAITPSAPLATAFPRARTWLAASTHEGEEEIVIDAHCLARQTEPDLRLILAPRHPARGDAVARIITKRGLSVSRRSTGDDPGGTDVYLADTMGEMALWYALAGRVFIAGTLTDRGGHTPYEPAAFGAALLHGPDVTNFAAPFRRLTGITPRVETAEDLAAALQSLSAPADQRDAGARAAEALRPETDLDGLAGAILAHLPHVEET